MYFTLAPLKEEVFSWLTDIYKNVSKENDQFIFSEIKSLILANIKSFVEMDPVKSSVLAERWFNGDHLIIVEGIQQNSQSNA